MAGVTSTEYSTQYAGRGDTGPYAINFPVFTDPVTGDAENVQVWVTRPGESATNMTLYSSVSGLNIYTTSEYEATYTVELRRVTPVTQTDPYLDTLADAKNSQIGASFDKVTHILNETIGSAADIKGDPGDSAYQLWIDAGNVGTFDDYLSAITGPTGATGEAGANGEGVPVGGTTGQFLKKTSGTNYDTEWDNVVGAKGGDPSNPVFYENDIIVSYDYTITTDKNAMSAGPIEIDAGVTVTVPVGSVWTIV